jgi:hypothetical protein
LVQEGCKGERGGEKEKKKKELVKRKEAGIKSLKN